MGFRVDNTGQTQRKSATAAFACSRVSLERWGTGKRIRGKGAHLHLGGVHVDVDVARVDLNRKVRKAVLPLWQVPRCARLRLRRLHGYTAITTIA